MAKILGVRVDNIDIEDALKKAKEFLYDGTAHTIYTPNPEMLVSAKKSAQYAAVLNNGSLNICDGRGIELLGRIKHRIPGVDFMQKLCEIAGQEHKSIYLLGGGPDIAKQAAQQLKSILPTLNIVGYSEGPQITQDGAGDSEQAIADILDAQPDILFVAFGHEKQEYWIDSHLPDIPSVKIAMGVGGSFDFLSGHIQRAPLWMRRVGLEWLYRLYKEPRRIRRIYTAVVLFPLLFLFSKR